MLSLRFFFAFAFASRLVVDVRSTGNIDMQCIGPAQLNDALEMVSITGFSSLFFLKRTRTTNTQGAFRIQNIRLVIHFAFFFFFGIGNMCKPNRCQADCFKFQIASNFRSFSRRFSLHFRSIDIGTLVAWDKHLPITTTQNDFMIARHRRRIAVRPSKPDMKWRGRGRGTVIMIGLRLRRLNYSKCRTSPLNLVSIAKTSQSQKRY